MIFPLEARCVDSAIELVAEIVRTDLAIDSLNLVVYEETQNWRDIPIPLDDAGIDFLIQGLQQDQGERAKISLSRCDVSVKNLKQIVDNLPASKLLGLQSNVAIAGGGQAQIPMMDFMCSPSARNKERLTCLLQSLCMGRGFLLESGRSYHYYGMHLLTEREWRVFLGKCLLMTGCVDERYVGHQLVNEYCVLRLSSGKLKNLAPIVVAEIDIISQ
jgi:hypothetical protein